MNVAGWIIRYCFLILPWAGMAGASTIGPFSGNGFDASAFNVIALGVIGGANANAGNFVPSSDIGGAVAVFGSYTGNGYAIDQQISSVPNPYTENYALIVNGNVSTNPFTVANSNKASVWIGGTWSWSRPRRLWTSVFFPREPRCRRCRPPLWAATRLRLRLTHRATAPTTW